MLKVREAFWKDKEIFHDFCVRDNFISYSKPYYSSYLLLTLAVADFFTLLISHLFTYQAKMGSSKNSNGAAGRLALDCG